MALGIIVGYILGAVLQPVFESIPLIIQAKLSVYSAQMNVQIAEANREIGQIAEQVEEISTFRIVEGTNVMDDDDDIYFA